MMQIFLMSRFRTSFFRNVIVTHIDLMELEQENTKANLIQTAGTFYS